MATVRHLGLFPWCTSASKSDPIWEDSTEITAEEATLLWWRAKTIGIRGIESMDVSINGVYAAYNPIQYNPALAASETALVCQKTNFRGLFQSGSGSSSGANFFYSVNVLWETSYDIAYNRDATNDSNRFLLLWRGRAIYDGTGIELDGNGQITAFSQFFFGVNNTGEDGSGRGTVFSRLFLGDKVIENTINDEVGELVIFGEGDVPFTFDYIFPNFEILEYWPYDPGDGGGPIYDSATGQQLRPFSSR
jgi:hypothetical protein